MKSGVRAVGIAESYSEDASHSTLAGAVVRADGVLEDLGYAACTVGGTDATDAVIDLLEEHLRPDVQAVLLGAVAPAWYNLLNLERIAGVAERPVLAVTFDRVPASSPRSERPSRVANWRRDSRRTGRFPNATWSTWARMETRPGTGAGARPGTRTERRSTSGTSAATARKPSNSSAGSRSQAAAPNRSEWHA